MIFKASYDILTKVLSVFLIVMIISIAAFSIHNLKEIIAWFPSVIIAISILSIVVPYCLSVKFYELTSEALIIHQPFSNVKYPLQELISADIVEPQQLRGSWRVFGSGGFLGYFGTFSNKNFGLMKWYATRKDRAVLIARNANKKILLSPDDAEGFVHSFSLLKGKK